MEATIVTTLSLILNFIFECCATNAFVVVPSSTTAIEGQNVTLCCTITNNTIESVSWITTNSLFVLSRGQTILRQALASSSQYDRLSISGNSDLGEYNLNFQNVQAEDAGQYTCGYFSVLQRQAIFSPKAVLSVILPPVSEYFPQNLDLTHGIQIQMVCTSQTNRPNTDLTWLRNGQLLRGGPNDQTERSNTISYLLTEDDYDQPFTCIEDMSPLSYVPHCFITPLRQTRKPVHIASSLEFVTNGDISHLTCLTNQSLESFSYRWMVDSNLTRTTTNMFSFGPVSRSDNGTIIRCEVYRGGELYGTDYIVIILIHEAETEAFMPVYDPVVVNATTSNPSEKSTSPSVTDKIKEIFKDDSFTVSLVKGAAVNTQETFIQNPMEGYVMIFVIFASLIGVLLIIAIFCLAMVLARNKQTNYGGLQEKNGASSTMEMREPSNADNQGTFSESNIINERIEANKSTCHDSPPMKGSTEMVYAARIYNSHPGSDESPEDYVPMAGSTEMVYNRQIYDCSQHFYHQSSNLEDDSAHYHSIE